MFDLALLFVCVFLLSFKHFDHLALGKMELVFVLIVHLFVSYAHVNLCYVFSSSWCRGLAAASACGSSWTFLFTFLHVTPLCLCCVESLFRDNSVTSSIPTYFENPESPMICFNKPFRNTILNFSELVSDLDTETNSPDS